MPDSPTDHELANTLREMRSYFIPGSHWFNAVMAAADRLESRGLCEIEIRLAPQSLESLNNGRTVACHIPNACVTLIPPPAPSVEGDAAAEQGKRPCTCTGVCSGVAGLGEGWYCVLTKALVVDLPSESPINSAEPAPSPVGEGEDWPTGVGLWERDGRVFYAGEIGDSGLYRIRGVAGDTVWCTQTYNFGHFGGWRRVPDAEEVGRLRAERDTLAKFKEYVHKRLDEACVPANPAPPKHALSGCRIGDRLDYIIERMNEAADLWTKECEGNELLDSPAGFMGIQ